MKHLSMFALALLLMAGTANAQHQGWTFELVGFSSGTVAGNAGVIGMSDECQVSFGAARMCTAGEVMDTVLPPDPLSLSGPAWVRPKIVGFGFSNGVSKALETNGRVETNALDFSCSGWGTTSGTGLTVSDVGAIATDACSVARPVACCKLMETPAAPPAMVASIPLWFMPAAAGGLLGAGVMRANKRSTS